MVRLLDKALDKGQSRASKNGMSEMQQETAEPVLEEGSQMEPKQREPEVAETAIMIADALAETGEMARSQIQHIVWVLGRTQARALLERTREIEAEEGLLVAFRIAAKNAGRRLFPPSLYGGQTQAW